MAKKYQDRTNVKVVTLSTPVIRGEQQISEITLNKPNVLALKGLNLLSVMQLDVNSALELLPRITQPTLTKADLIAMEVDDFTALVSETTAFFVKAEATATDETEA
ncbi:hypothetical protein A4G19_08630 [Pasteurellaceae bacterium Macca]|nr:hypothetical protein [Pasteurellaceae bacterium Macca]